MKCFYSLSFLMAVSPAVFAQETQPAGSYMHPESYEYTTYIPEDIFIPDDNEGPSQGEVSGDPITEAPQGTTKLYMKESAGTFYALDTAWRYGDSPEDVFATYLIWGEDNDVYFYNLCALANTATFVKGVVNDNTIILPLPQPAYVDDISGRPVNLVMLKAHDYMENGREVTEYLLDDSFSEVTYSISEDGKISLIIPGEPYDGLLTDYALGYAFADDGEWTGYSECMQELTPFEGELLSIPQNLEYSDYSFIYDNYGIVIEVAFDGDKAYIKGFNPNIPNAVFMGNIRDGKLYIPQDEIIAIYENCFMYTKCVYDNPDYDIYDDYSPEYILAAPDAEFVFSLDEDNHVISTVDSEMYLCLNGAQNRIYSLCAYRNFSLVYIDSYEGTPKNPFDTYYYADDFDTLGSAGFWFSVPNISTGNTLLDNASFYYRIYVNGEVYTLEEGENPTGMRPAIIYPGLEEPTELIPYNFNNMIDVVAIADTPRRCIFLYLDPKNITTLGVQSVYIYDGVTTESYIVTRNLRTNAETVTPPSSEDPDAGINVIGGEALFFSVYNMQGIKVLETKDASAIGNLPSGLYIVNGKKTVIRH